jgi:copper chaperone
LGTRSSTAAFSETSGPIHLEGIQCVQRIRRRNEPRTPSNAAARIPEDSMQQMTMAISGMTCGGCVSAVKRVLGAVPGTHVDAVTVGSATVSYDASRTTPAALSQAIRDAGYEPVPDGATAGAGAGASGSRKGGSCCG